MIVLDALFRQDYTCIKYNILVTSQSDVFILMFMYDLRSNVNYCYNMTKIENVY